MIVGAGDGVGDGVRSTVRACGARDGEMVGAGGRSCAARCLGATGTVGSSACRVTVPFRLKF